MKKIIYAFCLFLIYFSYLNVFAIDKCTSSEMARLKELANNVKFNYNHKFEMVDEEYHEIWSSYNFEILNFNNDLKIYVNGKDDLIDINTFKNRDFSSGEVVFYIYSYTNNLCTDELLKKVQIDLPLYNEYYYFNKDKCSEYPEFKFCKEFMNISDYNFEEIDKEFQEYIKKEDKNNFINKDNYKLYFIIGGFSLVLIIGVSILIIIKKKGKNSDI